MKRFLTTLGVASLLLGVASPQIKKLGEPDGYDCDQGGFTFYLPKHLEPLALVQKDKTYTYLLQFQNKVAPTVIIKAFMAMWDNPKGETIDAWAQDGKVEWMMQPGYQEIAYKQVEFKGCKTFVHTFKFRLADDQGHMRDSFEMKSIRLMRGTVGYWFVFYATPVKYDEYVKFWDDSLNSIKWKEIK